MPLAEVANAGVSAPEMINRKGPRTLWDRIAMSCCFQIVDLHCVVNPRVSADPDTHQNPASFFWMRISCGAKHGFNSLFGNPSFMRPMVSAGQTNAAR